MRAHAHMGIFRLHASKYFGKRPRGFDVHVVKAQVDPAVGWSVALASGWERPAPNPALVPNDRCTDRCTDYR